MAIMTAIRITITLSDELVSVAVISAALDSMELDAGSVVVVVAVETDGAIVGSAEGWPVVSEMEADVGCTDGLSVGTPVGLEEGSRVGSAVGSIVGSICKHKEHV